MNGKIFICLESNGNNKKAKKCTSWEDFKQNFPLIDEQTHEVSPLLTQLLDTRTESHTKTTKAA